nr:D-alanyl-D-alanine carboxypeptidase/D-alanyl-D-alanine-endopeptidase [Nocardioides perillae]
MLLVAAATTLAWRAQRLDPRLADALDDLVAGTPLEAWGPPDPAEEPEQVDPPRGLDLPDPAAPVPVARPVTADDAGALDPGAVRRALRRELRDPDLGRHVVAAVAPLGGGAAGQRVVLGRDPVVPASTTKLLTGAAALAVLGPRTTFATTTVLEPAGAAGAPPAVTLVGGGDPLLARTPERDGAAYPDRADVRTLARATAAALRERGVTGRVRVAVDDTLFAGPAVNPAWEADYVPQGVVTPIGPLWVDQGRTADGTARVDDPAREAGRVLLVELRRAGLRTVGPVVRRAASPGATPLAAVESPTVAALVAHLVETSDNETSEVLAHHLGRARGGPREASFAGGAAATVAALRALEVDVAGLRLRDGSGLSRRNRVPTTTLLEVLQTAASDQTLRPLLVGLPVAGFTGSLATRFDTGPAVALGAVRAKTGTLTGVRALAGLATTRDGVVVVFALGADRIRLGDDLDAAAALDEVAAALAACRCAAAP